ncbi:MAG: class I SAM-dependent methyltransferase [Candidatus Hodarchaeales archaeon]|jgi:predicted SAM-dependent methyltransferase
MMRLNMGSGGIKKAGFINVDLYHSGADIKADVAETNFKPNTVDVIYCSHVVEHLTPAHFERALQHWYDILKPDGKLEILCPNALVYLEEWVHAIKHNDLKSAMVWGRRNILGWEDKGDGMINRNLFTAKILETYIKAFNFEIKIIQEQETRVKDPGHIEYRNFGDLYCLAMAKK